MKIKFAKELPRWLQNSPLDRPIVLWGSTLLLWFGFFHFLESTQLALAYGSFLLWAVSAGFLWGKKAPFLMVFFFLVASWFLQKSTAQSNGPWHGFTLELGLWTCVVLLSSLSSSLWIKSQQQASRVEDLELGLLQVGRLASIGRMVVSIGHEMKNQIAVTVGFLELIKDEGEIPEAYKNMIDRSLLANDKMLKLLTQIRTLAQDTTHEPLQDLALHPLIREAIVFLERPIVYNGIALDLVPNDQLPAVKGNAVQLQTIFIDLLLQSLENFKARKISDGQPKRIRIETSTEGGRVRIHYSDNSSCQESWKELDWVVTRQLILKLGGSIEIQASKPHGRDVIIHLNQARIQADQTDHEALAAS